jgi:hypothetical protein
MENQFVGYNEAKQLSELGFSEQCFAGYLKEEKTLWIGYVSSQGGEQFNREYHILAPTYYQAVKFIRDKYNLCYAIDPYDDGTYDYTIFNPYITDEEDFEEGPYKTYEEAEQACLVKLIVISKGLKK